MFLLNLDIGITLQYDLNLMLWTWKINAKFCFNETYSTCKNKNKNRKIFLLIYTYWVRLLTMLIILVTDIN